MAISAAKIASKTIAQTPCFRANLWTSNHCSAEIFSNLSTSKTAGLSHK